MNIEQAILQTKPFGNVYQKATVNLMYTHNVVLNELHNFFKAFEITIKQYNILRILNGAQKPVSTSFIKERLLDRNSDVSRIVNRMETKSIVKKRICETDKRLVDVELTAKGLKLLNTIKSKMTIMGSILDNLSEDEAKVLNNLLDKIRKNK